MWGSEAFDLLLFGFLLFLLQLTHQLDLDDLRANGGDDYEHDGTHSNAGADLDRNFSRNALGGLEGFAGLNFFGH